MLLTYVLSGRHQNKLYQASLPFFSPMPLLRLPIFFCRPAPRFFIIITFENFPPFNRYPFVCFWNSRNFSQLLSNLSLWLEERLARDFLTNQNNIGWVSLVASDWKTKWHVIFWPIKIARNVERHFHLIGGDSGQLANAVLQNTKNFLKKKTFVLFIVNLQGMKSKRGQQLL